MKKIFTLTALLMAAMVAQAATYYGFKIGGVSVNSDNYQNVTGSNITSGTVVYDPASKTVTLTDVTISRTGSDNRAIYNESNSGLTVKLVGTNNLSATQAAPVRIQKNTTITVSSGTTTITGGSEGGIYISGSYDLSINGPGTLNISTTSKGGIEGSNDLNSVSFFNVNATIYGGGGDILDVEKVLFYNSVNAATAPKTVTLKSISSSQPNVKNVKSMGFSPNVVIQQPVGANFNSSSKSIANYDYTNNAFLSDVKGADIVISDKDVVAEFDFTIIPDATFRNFLIQKFSKRYITTADVNTTYRLSVDYKGISNLQGIQYFTALEYLECQGNNLTSLDVSALTALTELYCSNNQLTTLDVSHNPNLKYLYCHNNRLTTLDLSNNSNVETVGLYGNNVNGTGAEQFVQNLPKCSGSRYIRFIDKRTDDECNELTFEQVPAAKVKGWIIQRLIDTSGFENYEGVVYINATNFPDANFRSVVSAYNTDSNGKLDQDERAAVTQLIISNKSIANLQGINYFTKLKALDCSANKLTSLDVSQNTKLTYLGCANNQLATLNVAGCTQLVTLLCSSNKLQQLDLTANKALQKLSCEANKLTSLKVWTDEFPAAQNTNFFVYNNQLGSDAVDQFIKVLDNRPTRKSYYIFTRGADDQKMTTAQVQQSRAKGWWPMKINNGQLSVYEGLDEYPITIAGTQVTSDNCGGVTGDGITGTITYDPVGNVLTLDNASVTSSAVNAIRVGADLPGLNIKLEGDNTITMTNPNKSAINFFNSDDAVIEGPGKLHFNNASAAIYLSSGPGSGYHRTTIRNCEISANDPTTFGPSGTSIMDDDGDANLTIENASVRLARGNIYCGYDLQLIGCYISKPEGGHVVRGSVCATDSNSFFTGEIEILSETPATKGDVNGDGNVDVADLNMIINIMLGKAPFDSAADITGDGTVDVTDVNIIINIML